MGAGSAAMIWYGCCCSFVAFSGIVATALIVYGRKREESARSLPIRTPEEKAADDAGAAPKD